MGPTPAPSEVVVHTTYLGAYVIAGLVMILTLALFACRVRMLREEARQAITHAGTAHRRRVRGCLW